MGEEAETPPVEEVPQTLAIHPLHNFSVNDADEPRDRFDDAETDALSSLSSSETSISNHDELGPPSWGGWG